MNNLNNMKSYFGEKIKTQISKEIKDKNENNELYEEPLEGDLHEDDIEKLLIVFGLI